MLAGGGVSGTWMAFRRRRSVSGSGIRSESFFAVMAEISSARSGGIAGQIFLISGTSVSEMTCDRIAIVPSPR